MQEHAHRFRRGEDSGNAQKSGSGNGTEDRRSRISSRNRLTRVTERGAHHHSKRHGSDRACSQGVNSGRGWNAGPENG
jgi:hypothetical protein